jgi:hypothetical protein
MNLKTILITSALLSSPGAALADPPASHAVPQTTASPDARSHDPSAAAPDAAKKPEEPDSQSGQLHKPPTPDTAPAGVQPDKPA